MNNNLNKIKKCILESKLTMVDQEEFLELLSKAKDDDLEDIVALFESDPEYILIMHNVYRAKRAVLKRRDKKAWADILLSEYQSLKEIEKE